MKFKGKDKLALEELLERYHFKKSLASNFEVKPKAVSHCVFDDMYETVHSYDYSLKKLGIHWESPKHTPVENILEILKCNLDRIEYDAKYDDFREAKYKITKIEDVLRKLNKTEKKLLKAYFRK